MQIHVRVEVDINRLPSEVFLRLIDFAEWPKWGSQLVSMEKVTPGPLQVGTQIRQISRRGAQSASTIVHITDLTANQSLGIKSPDLAAVFTIAPAGAWSRLASEVDVEAHGVAALMYRVLLKQFLAGDLRRFKRLVETRPIE